MNDFDYENMQKKRLAKNAIHRKCGSKSQKCSLPSDYLTAKQRKELNGMETTYKMNVPVAWNVFKMWPNDIQKEYLSGLSERYHVGAARIAGMFGITQATAHSYFVSHKLAECVPFRGKMKDIEIAKWNDFVTLGTEAGKQPERKVYDEVGEGESTTWYKDKEVKETRSTMTSTVVMNGDGMVLEVSERMMPVEEPVECKERVRMKPVPSDFEMSFTVGTDGVTAEAVLEMMKTLLGEGPKGMLTVRFQRARKKKSDKKVQGFCAPDGENAD